MRQFNLPIAQWGLFCLFLTFSACGGEAPETPPIQTYTKTNLDSVNVYVIAGDYYEMQLGIRGNEITGVYRKPDAEDDACLFLFEGKIGTQNPIEVKCYNPQNNISPFIGWFKIMGDVMIARLNTAPNESCEPEFTDAVGHSLVLDSQKEWTAIRMVQAATPLYEDKESLTKIGEELPKGTIVAVKEKRGTWLWVDVLDENKEEGWIEEQAVYN